MPLNILDAEDIELGARRRADRLMKEFTFRWNQPQIDTALHMQLREIYRKVNPQTAQRIDEVFTGGKNGADQL